MGLPEDDKAYYEEQEGIERCIRAGTLIECICGRISTPYFVEWDDNREWPRCKVCVNDLEEERDV